MRAVWYCSCYGLLHSTALVFPCILGLYLANRPVADSLHSVYMTCGRSVFMVHNPIYLRTSPHSAVSSTTLVLATHVNVHRRFAVSSSVYSRTDFATPLSQFLHVFVLSDSLAGTRGVWGSVFRVVGCTSLDLYTTDPCLRRLRL